MSRSEQEARAKRLAAWRGKDPIEQVALEAGVKARTAENWFRGVNTPSAEAAWKLEKYRPGFFKALGLAA
jgi:hypothetical protein